MTKDFIKENLLGSSGRLIHQRIKDICLSIEELYCIYNDVKPQKCKKCNKLKKFISFNKGYSNKCSNKKCNLNIKHIHDFTYDEIKEHITAKGLDANFSAICFESVQEIYNYFYKTQSPKCSLCHSDMKFISFNLGYSEDKCININCNNIKAKIKREETCQSKYGDRHFNNRDLMKKTKLERYGDEKYANTKQAKETKKLRYGNENFVNIEKRKQTVKRLKESNISRSKLHPKFNLNNLNKKYIEENFIKDGLLMSNEFMNYYNCKENWMNTKLRELQVHIGKIKIKPFEKDLTKFQDCKGRISSRKLKKYNITSEELYLMYNNMDKPKCLICNNDVKYMGFKRGYNNFCSIKCSNKARDINSDNVYDTASFIKKAKEVHGDLYDYSLVQYKNAQTKVKIICKEHGVFEQLPYNHNSGGKCFKCSYLSREKEICWTSDRYKDTPTILYYIRLKKQNLYKIGITKRSIKERFTKEELKNIEVIFEDLYEDGSKAFEKEYKILKENKKFQYKGPKILKKGNTELFIKDIMMQ